jgi:glucose/arabinose dehydrogenase
MNNIFKKLSTLLIAMLLSFNQTFAASVKEIPQQDPRFKLEQLAQGLGIPWGMAFLNDSELIFTERAGNIKILNLENLEISIIRGGAKVAAQGQGGMLDVAPGPNFDTDGWIYFTYVKPTNAGAVTTLARSRRNGNRLTDWQDLLVTQSATGTTRHFGSRIAFDGKGHVFFGIGDRGERENSQNLNNHAGSVIRLRLDGSIPRDNPFVGQPRVRPEIWSYGHRNPQGLIFDPAQKILWSIEHGPRGGDEINQIYKGRNYGWPVVSHGKEYWGPVSIGEGTEKPGMESPLKVYIPSIAPGSLMIYNGEAFPIWKGNLFAGALVLQHLNRVPISASHLPNGEERLLEDLGERIRALAQSPQGWIYFSTDSGKIMRLRPR